MINSPHLKPMVGLSDSRDILQFLPAQLSLSKLAFIAGMEALRNLNHLIRWLLVRH